MAPTPFRVKAIYDYSSPHDDDLSFPNGQIILVTDEEDADWYFGEYADTSGNKQSGLFPKNFVNLHEPETPPRPSRQSRPKKETETSPAVAQAEELAKSNEPDESEAAIPPARSLLSNTGQSKDIEQSRGLDSPVAATAKSPEVSLLNPPVNTSTKSASSSNTKTAPPPVIEKPTVGSFRDRINAFNKSTAPPVAPLKPSGLGSSGGSSFIKKPFVAPPPSKNAYVPPPREVPAQKIYRREEDPEVVTQSSNGLGIEVPPSTAPNTTTAINGEEDQPKPTSLKDRIALLQKQQMEQAARHAEAGQKREKPKRPPKKQFEAQEEPVEQGEPTEDYGLDRISSTGTTDQRSADAVRDESLSEAHTTTRSRDATFFTSPTAPARGFQSDANDADQSGAGDTEGDDLSTGRDSDEKPRSQVPMAQPHQQGVMDDDSEGDEDEEEPEMDPEMKRRMEIRERMAKMSGGMGMAGMFGPAPGMPPAASRKQGSASSDRKAAGKTGSASVDDTPIVRAPSIPVLSVPGMHRVRSPEQEDPRIAASQEDEGHDESALQGHGLDQMPDMANVKQEPALPPRMSVDRGVPPPVPQGRRPVRQMQNSSELRLQ